MSNSINITNKSVSDNFQTDPQEISSGAEKDAKTQAFAEKTIGESVQELKEKPRETKKRSLDDLDEQQLLKKERISNPEEKGLPEKKVASLGEKIKNVNINASPWAPKEIEKGPLKRFKCHQDPELLAFVDFLQKKPDASEKDIETAFKSVTQNCATNTILGLSQIGAVTVEGLSPRAELLKERSTNAAGINLAIVLGLEDQDYNCNAEPETQIPQGTVIFFVKQIEKKNNPFLHVAFAEKTGRNDEAIYRSLNGGHEKSELQTLAEICKDGGYNVMNSTTVFSKKYSSRYTSNEKG